MDGSNNPDFLNKGPWYNTAICSSLHGIMSEYCITHAITNIYNFVCYIVAHDLKNLLMKMMKALLEIV